MPEAYPKPFASRWAMTPRQKRQIMIERFDCKRFVDIGLSGGTSIKAFQLGSGQCNSPSVHPIGTPPPCALSTQQPTERSTTRSLRLSRTQTLSSPRMIILKSKKGLLFWLRRRGSETRKRQKLLLLQGLMKPNHRSLRRGESFGS